MFKLLLSADVKRRIFDDTTVADGDLTYAFYLVSNVRGNDCSQFKRIYKSRTLCQIYSLANWCFDQVRVLSLALV